MMDAQSPIWSRILPWLALLLVSLLLLAACAVNEPLTAQTNSYEVRMTLDQRRIGDRNATIEISRRDGGRAVIDEVRVMPLMRQHGMASPEVVARSGANGSYQIDGIQFTMDGEWQLDVVISGGGARETAAFQVIILP